MTGFDFYRDPLGAMKPGTDVRGGLQGRSSANKPKVTARQKKLLESRYNLEPKLRPEGHDVARQAASGRADRPPADGSGLGRAGRD